MIISKAKEKLIVWESTYIGKSIITIPSGGKYTFKQLWEDLGYEEKLLHKGLRENGIMFVEQILNLNFKDILDWHHIQTTRPKRGKPPGWGKQVIDKRNTQKLKHYNIVTTNWEPTSVLLPCEGCEINTRENNEECVYRLDKNKEDKIEIPVIYSKKSTSNTLTKSFKNRIRRNVKDLYMVTAIMENYEEDVQENDTLNIPLNIIDEEDNQRKSEYHEIQKWTNCEDENIRELIYIKEKLKNKKQVKVYTDGSFETTLTENIMGFGWVIPEVKDYERLTFRGNIKNFPSSTRAELMAIFTALIVMPKRSKVIIYTDSACTIQNIKIITKQINTRKIWTENKNPVILQMINDIVQERRLKIICHKVKAHSGDKYNEIADSLAKIPGFIEGITNNIFEGTTISLNYNNITDCSFIPIWKFTPIETPVKNAIKEINRLKLMLNFKYQERFKYIMTNTKCREIDWDLTFKTKHPSKITLDITNKEGSNKRSFALKLLCEELPTLSKRYIHKPNLYSSSSCILCEKLVEEDNMHVFICKRKGQIDPIKNLTNKFKEILIEKIRKEEPGIDIKIIKKVVSEVDILNYTYEKDYTLSKNYSDLSFFDVIKGFIPNILVTKVKKICRNKKAKANKIIIDVLEEFQKILKQIWKERCDKVIEWEIKNGITNKDKRTRQIRNDKRTKIQIDKISNIKEGNLHISKMMEKINFQRKQKQKEEDLEFFTNEIFLNTFTYKGNNLYKIKIFSDGDMAISS
ncbi:hypothetical protein Glove_350g167 [Diversispora epigaea]|uniref:ribonuclease H n=1 Tax=Diversispora epigaea TaxID=1348612 RepID=A0A397HHB8_9GLOM|nr:hypothetical protein Glove_350g167 [Diversispora epigaea]